MGPKARKIRGFGCRRVATRARKRRAIYAISTYRQHLRRSPQEKDGGPERIGIIQTQIYDSKMQHRKARKLSRELAMEGTLMEWKNRAISSLFISA